MSAGLICGCGNHLRVTEAHAGRKVKCPACGASLVVPERFGIQQPREHPTTPQGGTVIALPIRRGDRADRKSVV